jgi:hypothetical protein
VSHFGIYLCPELKARVKVHNFQTHESVGKAVTDVIKILTEVDFQCCYKAWKIRLNNSVVSEGCHFERDNDDLGVQLNT